MIALGAFIFGAIVGSSGQGGTAAAPSAAPTVTVTATADSDGKVAPTVTVTAEAGGKAAATVTVTATATATAEAGNSSGESWGDGMHKVGTDIQPGKYVTTVPSESIGCYYALLNSSDTSDIKTNNVANAGSKAYVTISSSDAFFESRDCGDWKKDK